MCVCVWLGGWVCQLGLYFTSYGRSAQCRHLRLARRQLLLLLLTFNALVTAPNAATNCSACRASAAQTGAGVDVQSHHLHHRVKLVHGMAYVLDGQILWHIEHVQREGLSRPTWYGNLYG